MRISELDRIEAERWRMRFEGADRRGHGVLVWATLAFMAVLLYAVLRTAG